MAGIYWLASYPKSGNTWLRIFLRNFIEDGEQPVDINALSAGRMASSRYWLDEVLGFDTTGLTADEVDQIRPEVYRWTLRENDIDYRKIHDAYTMSRAGEPLFGGEASLGAIYILRNPLDVVPSYASHRGCDIDEVIGFMASHDHCLDASRSRFTVQVRQKLLTWSEHVLSWVDAVGLNCHVIRYEDMLQHPKASFADIVRFLALPDNAERLDKAIRFSDFKEVARQETERGFRENPQPMARFFRQGKRGDWRDKLTPGQVDRIIVDHGEVMRRFGYLDAGGNPI